ncbi:MAG: MFS transporter [Bacteroidetes bacterium]|nr:MAG: MFS transporter [Bacteroidota bacterium]
MRKIGGFTIQFWLLCLSSFLFFSSFNMMIPELPAYLTSLGGADYKGYIIALFTLSAALSRPFSGKLADTVGRIPVMVFGAGVCFILGFLYPEVGTVWAFLLLRFFHGFSTGFKPTGTSAYVADVVPENKRGEAMGMLGVFGSLGIAAGPAVGGVIANQISINAMFYSSSVFAILSVLILLGMTETVTVKHKFKPSLLIIPFNEVFEPRVIAPSITMFLSAFSFGVILTLIPDFSVHLGIMNKGLFFVSFTATSILVRVIAGKISDRYGRVEVLRYSTILVMISMWFIGIATNPTHFFLAGALIGIAAGTNSPTIFAWTIDLSHPMHRGRAMATMYIAMEIGIGIGALVSAYIFNNQVANIPMAFNSAAILAGLAFIYIQFIYKPKLQVDEN